ncbi:MAG: hypothetical protein M3M95_08575 [Pseudomonadota bacterium]|nr:hypothetical protein [Pseudomonadota bacterium]
MRPLIALLFAAAPLAAEAQSVTRVPRETAPMIPVAPTVEALLGRSEAEVRRILGEPLIARREEGGAMWTYRRPTCALYVFFRPSGREGMRVTGLSSGPLQQGAAAPDVNACLSYGAVL